MLFKESDGDDFLYALSFYVNLDCFLFFFLGQVEVRLSETSDLLHQDKVQIKEDLKLFLQPVREKLLQFEQELKDR